MLAARTPGPEPVWHGDVAVHGGRLPIAMAGKGAPLILLHGWTLDHRMWQPQVEGLAADFRLVMPDRRGCGGASAPPDLAREADDVLAIADAFGLRRFALAGLSRGAAIALDFAQKHCERLTGVVVSGAPLPALVPREEVIALETFRAWAAAGDLAALRRAWALHPLMQVRSHEAQARLTAMLADYEGRDLLIPSTAPDLPRSAMAALPMPVLALTGEHDTPWRRDCARALAEIAPRGHHALVGSAGHLANLDNPHQFNRIMRDFLLGCAASPR